MVDGSGWGRVCLNSFMDFSSLFIFWRLASRFWVSRLLIPLVILSLVNACLIPSRGLDCETWWLSFNTLRVDSILTGVASFLALIPLKFNFPTPFSFKY